MKRYRRTRSTQRHQPPDLFKDHLAPLKRGRSVKLVVEIQKQNGKQKRTQQYLALLAPANLYDLVPQAVVISVIGKGSCIIFPNMGTGVSDLVKAGLPVKLAVALLEKLRELFGEEHGDT